MTHHTTPGRTEGKGVNAFYQAVAEWVIYKSLATLGELQHSTWSWLETTFGS